METLRIIINADDCGICDTVDKEIERCILAGKITSTTIMANMDDFEGAVNLYRQYKDYISFGWHMNLDEGESLTKSQLLLDKGYFIEKDGKCLLNGSAFKHILLTRNIKDAIKKELYAQYEKIRDSGIEITHADSHHFYHTRMDMIQLFPSFFRDLGITRCRHLYNYGMTGVNGFARKLWSQYFRLSGMRMPESFCFFKDYIERPYIKKQGTLELMIHPGHQKTEFSDEYNLMWDVDYNNDWPNCELISYNSI